MKAFRMMGAVCLKSAVCLFLFNTGAGASEGLHEGDFSALFLHESVGDFESQAGSFFPSVASPLPAAIPARSARYPDAVTAFKIYGFQALSKRLGHPDPAGFGASESELQVLAEYTNKDFEYYKEANGYLRFYPGRYKVADGEEGDPKMGKRMVENLDRFIERTPPLPGDLILFRGLDLKFRANKSYAIGEEFFDKAYVSASTSFKVAQDFARGDRGRAALFVIYSNRPGEKGILVDEGEDEVILRHGLKFRAMAKKNIAAGPGTGTKRPYELYLVQLCSAPCETALGKSALDFWTTFSAAR